MDISTNVGKRPRVPNEIITQEEANELVWEALDCYPDEPEGFVKLLVILYDNTTDNYLQEAVYRLVRAAFNFSIVHSFTLQDYMAALREGRNPLEEARARCQASQAEARDETNKPNKRKRKSKHRKTRS